MANVIIEKLPDSVNFIKNDLTVRLKSVNPFYLSGKKIVFKLFIGNSGTSGDNFTLTWNNRSISFICSNSPNPNTSAQYISLASAMAIYQPAIMPIGAWEQMVFKTLKSNYYISKDFDLSHSVLSHQIIFTAKEFGSKYSIQVTSSTATGAITSPGTDQMLKTGYKLMFNTFIEGEFAFEDRLSIDDNQGADFDLSDALTSSFDMAPQLPDNSIFRKQPNHAKEIGFTYGEFFDREVQKVLETDKTFYAIPGGLSDAIIQDIINKNITTEEWLSKRKDWLTWLPSNIKVGKTQIIQLRYLSLENQDITLNLEILTPNGMELHTITLSVSQFEAVEFSTTISSLELKYNLKVLNFRLFLVSSTGLQLTIKRTFIHDNSIYRNETVFIFRNSLGAYDSVRAMGPSSEQLKIKRKKYFTKLNKPGLFHKLVQNINYSTPIKYNTGSLFHHSLNPREYLVYLSDLLLSEEVYRVVGQQLYPVVINTKKTTIYESDDYNPALIFEAELDLSQQVYSNDMNLHPTTMFDANFDNKFKK